MRSPMRNGPRPATLFGYTLHSKSSRSSEALISSSRYCRRLSWRSGFWLSVGMATRRPRSWRKRPSSKYFSMDWSAASRVLMGQILALQRNLQAMLNHPFRIGAAALLLSLAPFAASGQENLPDKFRASATWAPGEKQSYQVQQVVKERVGGKEETKFLSNGTLEITAVESTADALTFTWHRRMENAELELVREPWGIRGNAPYEKLLTSTVRDGLPLTIKLNLRTQRARIENRDDLVAALSRRLQSLGGESVGNVGRLRLPTPDERARDPT